MKSSISVFMYLLRHISLFQIIMRQGSSLILGDIVLSKLFIQQKFKTMYSGCECSPNYEIRCNLILICFKDRPRYIPSFFTFFSKWAFNGSVYTFQHLNKIIDLSSLESKKIDENIKNNDVFTTNLAMTSNVHLFFKVNKGFHSYSRQVFNYFDWFRLIF